MCETASRCNVCQDLTEYLHRKFLKPDIFPGTQRGCHSIPCAGFLTTQSHQNVRQRADVVTALPWYISLSAFKDRALSVEGTMYVMNAMPPISEFIRTNQCCNTEAENSKCMVAMPL